MSTSAGREGVPYLAKKHRITSLASPQIEGSYLGLFKERGRELAVVARGFLTRRLRILFSKIRQSH